MSVPCSGRNRLISSCSCPIPVPPAWSTGIALGIGGLAGAYTGPGYSAAFPMPDPPLVGILVIAIGARYPWPGLN
jgi:uncharacterized membrane protein YfcA